MIKTIHRRRLPRAGKPNDLRAWMSSASPAEKEKLAVLAKTTLGTLRQAAGAYRTGGVLRVEPDLARRIELATAKMARDGLPALRRERLALACAHCEFAKACRG